MKRQLAFLLAASLTLAGTPSFSISEVTPTANQKANVSGHVAQKLNSDSKVALRNLESKNPALLNQKAGAEQKPVNSPDWDKDKPGGGIPDQAAVGIVLGGLVIAGIIFFTTAGNRGGC